MSESIDNKIDNFIKKSHSLTGQVIREREPWNTLATRQAIRHFAYGISDENPLWIDPDYSGQSKRGAVVAPPTFLTSVLYPALHGFPMTLPLSNLIGELEYQWFEPILEGDSLTPTAIQTGVNEGRDRKDHRLVSILAEINYQNQNDAFVGKASSNLVWVAREKNDLLLERSIYQYSESELETISQALQQESVRGELVLWGGDVELNTSLPPLVRGPLSVGDMICWQAAIGPSYRPAALGYRDGLKAPHSLAKNPVTGWSVKNSQQHEDFLLAKQRGMPAPFDNSVMRFAWLSSLLTNWMGDRGQLKRLSVQMIAPVIYGDTVWYEGTATKKTQQDSGVLVTVRITGRNQLGELTTTGEGDVLLPCRPQHPELSIESRMPRAYPEEPCVHQLIEEQVERKPNAIALVDAHRQLTYRHFNRQANQLAHYLKQFEIKPNDLIGICMERSVDYMIAVFAVLKAGGGYLPLDSDYPADRLAFMLKDAQIPVLITHRKLIDTLPDSDARIIDFDTIQSQSADQSGDNPANPISSNHLAYAVYTSGSTGQPKAVCVPHYSLSSYLRALRKPLGITPEDKYVHTASFAFSAGIRQSLLPLFVGAVSVIADEQQQKDLLQLFQLIKRAQITVWDTLPTVWRFSNDLLQQLEEVSRRNLLDNSLRLILTTGEPLACSIPHTWRYGLKHPAQIINLYSQSETTGTVSYYVVPEAFEQQTGTVLLGKPLEDIKILLCNEYLHPVKEGATGEICVTGKRQVQAYLNRPELTRQKFILNPSPTITHLYKTGDLARYLPDGNLEFVGRSDRRVKVRGFRVELEEIELALRQHPQVNEAAVITQENRVSGNFLIAYVISRAPELEVKELRAFLTQTLPGYMIPSTFVFLDNFPLTQNGKTDLKQLEQREVTFESEQEYVEPRTATEQQLASIWAEVLKVDKVGIHDNFFDLGGHSLLGIQAQNRIRSAFEIDNSLRILFESPTIETLSERIETLRVPDKSGHEWETGVL